MPFLQLTNISKRFGPTVALDSVNLRLEKGEVHAVIGENGAGKSTLMNILAGAFPPDSGTMEIERQPYVPTSPLDARRHGIALIHQELCLCPHLAVSENILLGIEPSHWGWVDRQAYRRKAMGVLESFHHPEIHPDRPIWELSIAARQVVEICRALVARASVILMDEPTSSLQRDDVEHLFTLIRRLRQEQITVIYISHFLEEIREIADGCTVLRDGRSISTNVLQSITDEQLVTQMVGRPVENLFPERIRHQDGEVVLEVRDLVASPLVKNASFELRRGEILGIAGLVGAGRTQMVRTLFGLQPAESGAVILKSQNQPASRGRPSDRILQGLGYLSEDRKGEGLALALSLADNVTLTRFSSCSRWGWLNLPEQRTQAETWLERLAVKAKSSAQPARTLSGGNQQKIVLARLLHQNVDILLLDEPTRGIDIGSKAKIYETIAQCAEQKKAILLVSSYLPELFGLCDRLAVMSRGKLSPARPISDWTPESVMQAAIGGKVAAVDPNGRG
ncbi:MAG TPA: sugar ABC transporter ATP-binding protein [Acidobacteriota bacterium]|jgi:ribose transport system ATP-binding protein|nr:sugar ABC transporter ATP-binding protein [Acidobacteriota bacterium]